MVLVATIGANETDGGVKKEDLKSENLKALEAGMADLRRHVENVKKFGAARRGVDQSILLRRHRSRDRAGEGQVQVLGVEALMADHWAMGGAGAADVAKTVVKVIDEGKHKLKFLYPDETPLFEKIEMIARDHPRARVRDCRQVGQ